MKSEILRLLKENDTYISGQQLCEQFQVSRTAIWKVIDQLKKEGYQIEAVRNKGYRLIESPDVMSKAEIDSLVDTKWAGKNVIYYDETDSTNNRAKEAGNNKEPHGTLFVADMQMAGKGRRGRVWKSPSGSSIYMTILLYPDIPPVKAPQLTLIMAIAVAEGIREVTGLETKIKWPNDIVVNGKKICGILTEMSTEIDYINHVVIGVGINVNQDTFPDDIKETASSLKMELGKQIKKYRQELQLSQEELADHVYVSRQTISNWENDKSYPDVTSLVLLSEIFQISLDKLIKGDIDTMKEVIKQEEIKKLNHYGAIYTVFLVIAVISAAPLFYIGNKWALILWCVIALAAMYFAAKVERIKKDNDVQTYKEIVAFCEGKRLDEIQSAREYGKRPYQKVLWFIGSAAVGAIVSYVLSLLLQSF